MMSANLADSATTLTADDLIRIFNDPDGELRHYAFRPIPAFADVKAHDRFRAEVPFDDIKRFVDNLRDAFFDRLDSDDDAVRPTFEHVGSTSVRGMPGTLSPDVLLVENSFPPSPSTIRALLALGFRFRSVAPHGEGDYWFLMPIPEDVVGPEGVVFLHLVDKDNKTGKLQLKMRDECINNSETFEEYKALKVEAAGDKDTTFYSYKQKKARSGIIARLKASDGI